MESKVLARLQIKDKRFEIWVDCDKAMEIKNGKSSDVSSALLVDKIFKDAHKGEVAGDLERYFKTDDPYKVALEIIKRGEVQLSASYREKQGEQLKNRVIDKIASEAIDVTTNLPIPRKRIELAMEQIHHNFDMSKPEKVHEEDILEKLKKILPIKLGEYSYAAEIPLSSANEALLYLKRLGNIKNNTRNDDSMTVTFSVRAGSKDELLSKLKSVTHGSVVLKEA